MTIKRQKFIVPPDDERHDLKPMAWTIENWNGGYNR